jgi:2-polyprenyl-3-methyl-5-hydroxy-6-metoxy-1,4-benzoquinol methylase
MEQTPLREYYNPNVLSLIPKDATRVVEVGCGGGTMAREYRKINPDCDYIGIEIVDRYADAARAHCNRVLLGNIEQMDDETFASLLPSSCWIFADVLEHLYDPWAVLRRIGESSSPQSSVIACIPNAQHWSVQARLNCGEFRYEDLGLMDRTHIRWFTKTTVVELFRTSGFEIVEGGPIMLNEPAHREQALEGVRAFAEAIGANIDEAVANASAFQWLVRAMPKP